MPTSKACTNDPTQHWAPHTSAAATPHLAVAPRLGFEPRQADSESAVLPLHHLGNGLPRGHCAHAERAGTIRTRALLSTEGLPWVRGKCALFRRRPHWERTVRGISWPIRPRTSSLCALKRSPLVQRN